MVNSEGLNCTRLVWLIYIGTYSEGINCSNNPCIQKWLPICRVSMFNTEGINWTRLVWLKYINNSRHCAAINIYSNQY